MDRFIMLQVDKLLKEYEAKETIEKEDIENILKSLDTYESITKQQNITLSEKNKEQIKSRIDVLKQKMVSATTMEVGAEAPTSNDVVETDKIPVKLYTNISKLKNVKLDKKTKKFIGLATVGIAALVVVATALVSCGSKKGKEVEEEKITYVESNNNVKPKKQEENEIEKTIEKVLSENLAFDVNDNKELVNRMAKFIADAMSKGIAVKDVMTDAEITTAEQNGVSFLTISQLMDYYFVMNVNDIDPIDYARLGYNQKTTDTILNNYMACANVLMDDLLTVKEDTVIDYTQIISDKESANAVQTFANMMGDLNSKKISSNDLTKYIEENYIQKYDDRYSISANEQTYRFMFSFDEVTNGKGIPSDMNIILNEDKIFTCTNTKPEGVKNKSERAQDETDIKNIIEDKLAISREFYNQDLDNVEDDELKSGVKLEQEIRDMVLSLNVSYQANPKFIVEPIKASTTSTSSKTNSKTTSSDAASNVKADNGLPIAQSELDKYNIDQNSPIAKQQYEQAVKDDFEQQAKVSDSHTITDTDGNVLVKGADVDTSSYNQGYSDGYYAGNNNKSYSPSSSGASYKAGYSEGYSLGKQDRQTLDNSYNYKNEEYFENVKDKVVKEEVEEKYYDYTSDPHANDNNYNVTYEDKYENSNFENNSSSSYEETYEEETHFEPVEEQVVEVIEEVKMKDYEAPHTVEVKTLTKKSENVNSLKNKYLDLRNILTNTKNMLNEVLDKDSKTK